jgi:MFS family permease
MRVFIIIWVGQVVSLLGSKLTEFALSFWILEKTYQQSGTITQFALTVLFISLPKVIFSPLAGVLVDRWNRRYGMLISDSVGGTITIGIMLLVFSNKLAIWHIYIAILISSTFGAFQQPAYMAAIAQLVPKTKLSQANGMVQASSAIAKISSPAIAGLLLQLVHLEGVLLIDCATFIFAVVSLMSVPFPQFTPNSPQQRKIIRQIYQDILSGWDYIAARSGLVWLLKLIAISYFTTGILEIVLYPLVLQAPSRVISGLILSIGGCGMLAGSLVMTISKAPERRVSTILGCLLFQGVIILLGGMRVSLVVLAIGIFGYLFSLPIIVICNQVILQTKIPFYYHGRVFALQQTVERASSILAYILVIFLLDPILKPLMSDNEFLANTLGKFIGIGADGAIALLLILLGLVNIVAVAIAYREPRLRNLETELPDINRSNFDFKSI